MFFSRLWKQRKKDSANHTDIGIKKEDPNNYDPYDNYHKDDNDDSKHTDNNIINSYDNYDNYDNLQNLVKTQSDLLNNVLNILEKHDIEVKELIKTIPAETIEKLKTIQKNYPRIYSSLMHKFEEKVRSKAVNYLDSAIIQTIKRYERIPSLKILEEITKKENLCTQSTLYIHLKKLVSQGIIVKNRGGKTVFYSLPSIKIEEIKSEDEIQKHYDGYDNYDNYDES